MNMIAVLNTTRNTENTNNQQLHNYNNNDDKKFARNFDISMNIENSFQSTLDVVTKTQESKNDKVDTKTDTSNNTKENDKYDKTDKVQKDDTTKAEESTQKEEVSNDGTVKDKVEGNSGVSEENVQMEETEQLQNMDEIMALIAQYLNMDVSEVKSTLENMGINLEEGFDMENLDSLLGEMFSMEQLLTDGDLQQNILTLRELLGESLKSGEENLQILDENLTQQVQTMVDETVTAKIMTEEVATEEVAQIVTEPTLRETANYKTTLNDIVTYQDANLQNQTGNVGFEVPVVSIKGQLTQILNNQENAPTTFKSFQSSLNSQIVNKIDINILQDGQEITINLDPKELGKLSMKIIEQNGHLTADIKVESEKTKEMLLTQLDMLKESLAEKGVTIGDFNVDVDSQPYKEQMQQQQQKSSKRMEEIIAKHMGETELDEVIEDVGEQIIHEKSVNIRA
ncbi:hypothetical protein AN640_00880 [Candidatus Epulonipiscium fishelsonii]|uniref:Uncharacterized protein n=1 Tax=Candidatus Epulonipiscium fishelsonii TaxID=77094 RepID=A0ACC8XJ18_9FIRM|nr:hypothetical protein AN640_00880 [Epulopiscium sp. SCG-D08WGA-EpuloA1]